VLGGLLTLVIIPETRGRSLEEINAEHEALPTGVLARAAAVGD